jgi:hypothetical protein
MRQNQLWLFLSIFWIVLTISIFGFLYLWTIDEGAKPRFIPDIFSYVTIFPGFYILGRLNYPSLIFVVLFLNSAFNSFLIYLLATAFFKKKLAAIDHRNTFYHMVISSLLFVLAIILYPLILDLVNSFR